jgi:hypothetical protein
MHQDTLGAFSEIMQADMASVAGEKRDERLEEHIEVILGGLLRYMLESIRRAQTHLETGEKERGNFISSIAEKSSQGATDPFDTRAVNRYPEKKIERRFGD